MKRKSYLAIPFYGHWPLQLFAIELLLHLGLPIEIFMLRDAYQFHNSLLTIIVILKVEFFVVFDRIIECSSDVD